MFATGWDRASAILKLFSARTGRWRRYRLPKASHCFDHGWATEWPRIRQTEHERLLVDCHGTFFELSPWPLGDVVFGLRPISTHLWVLGDFCSWRGMLVLGADNASAWGPHNILCGEPQSARCGSARPMTCGSSASRPAGAGRGGTRRCAGAVGPVPDDRLRAQVSARFARGGPDGDLRGPGRFPGHRGVEDLHANLPVGDAGDADHEFPAGFSAHWVRVTADLEGAGRRCSSRTRRTTARTRAPCRSLHGVWRLLPRHAPAFLTRPPQCQAE